MPPGFVSWIQTDTRITRDASGKITGRGSNQLLRLLK